jgi:hypothetical protein
MLNGNEVDYGREVKSFHGTGEGSYHILNYPTGIPNQEIFGTPIQPFHV